MLGVTRGKEYSCTPHRCLRDPVGVTFRFPPTNPRFFLAFHPYHYLAAQRESGGRRRAPVKTFHGNVRARSPLKIRNSSPRNVSQLLPLPPPLPLENAFPELLNNRTSPRMASFSRDSNGIYFRAWKEGRRVEKKGRREEKKGKKKKKNWIRWGGGKNGMAKYLVRSHPNSAHVRAAACRNQGWRRWKGVDGTARRGMVPQGCVPESG